MVERHLRRSRRVRDGPAPHPGHRRHYDVANDRYEPLFGPQNSVRLPAYFELDLRVDRRFRLGQAAVLHLYLELDNVTFRKNAEEIVYDHLYSKKSYVTGVPPLALLGGRLEF